MIESTIAPMATKAMLGCSTMNSTPQCGDRDERISGSAAMPRRPSRASTANHATMTGPNSRPTRAVPARCTRKSPVMTMAPSGTSNWRSEGSGTERPSMADMTEMAGVMTLSP